MSKNPLGFMSRLMLLKSLFSQKLTCEHATAEEIIEALKNVLYEYELDEKKKSVGDRLWIKYHFSTRKRKEIILCMSHAQHHFG